MKMKLKLRFWKRECEECKVKDARLERVKKTNRKMYYLTIGKTSIEDKDLMDLIGMIHNIENTVNRYIPIQKRGMKAILYDKLAEPELMLIDPPGILSEGDDLAKKHDEMLKGKKLVTEKGEEN